MHSQEHDDSGRPLVYLACPYSHAERDVRVKRFEASNAAACELMKDGYYVFAPISMSHPIAEQCGVPGDWNFWADFDTAFISCCKKLFVITIDGWDKSTGVTAERKIAENFGIPVVFLKYSEVPVDGKHFLEVELAR
jgi:hypothetical protein